jgi:hypothetical protein
LWYKILLYHMWIFTIWWCTIGVLLLILYGAIVGYSVWCNLVSTPSLLWRGAPRPNQSKTLEPLSNFTTATIWKWKCTSEVRHFRAFDTDLNLVLEPSLRGWALEYFTHYFACKPILPANLKAMPAEEARDCTDL